MVDSSGNSRYETQLPLLFAQTEGTDTGSDQLALFGTREEDSTLAQWAPGTITFDGREYRYTGFVLDITMSSADRYLPKSFVFSPDDAGVESSCDRSRVCAMLDRVGRDRQRQREIQLYGKRIWHSLYRLESAAEQALDFVFGHNVTLVARVLPYVEAFFHASPEGADVWTHELRAAYSAYRRWHEKQELVRLLSTRGVPASEVLGL